MKNSKAKGKVQLAISRLASEQPLAAGILGQWRLVEDETVKTMAVGFRHAKLTLYFAPEFVEGIRMDELVGVIEHEALHVLLGHVLHEATPSENVNARRVSEECCVNEWVSHPLPGKPVLLSDYPFLPENEDVETRYDRLKDIIPETKIITLDDHSKWDELIASGQLSSAVVSTVIAKVWGNLSPEQKTKVHLPPEARKIVDAAVKAAGSSEISMGKSVVPWRQVLRMYVGKTLSRKSVWNRPPRRFPHLLGVVPGKGRQRTRPHVVFALDTSGSVSSALLSDFSAELTQIARTHQVTVIEASNVVHAVYKFRQLTSISGRGGTDFRPAFQEAVKLHADLMVYATDGFGRAPEVSPRLPVIWLLSARGRRPTSWGKEIRIFG